MFHCWSDRLSFHQLKIFFMTYFWPTVYFFPIHEQQMQWFLFPLHNRKDFHCFIAEVATIFLNSNWSLDPPFFSTFCSSLYSKTALDVLFNVPVGWARDYGSRPSRDVKTDLKFRESVSASKAILAKRFLLVCNGITFELRISSVNVTKFIVSCGFGHIYWRNP